MAEGIEVQAWLLRVLAPFVERQAPRLARRLALGTKYRELFSKVEADFRAGERVERLAAGLNLRPRSFQRAFRRDTGSTLKAWLSAQLMERAQSLLLSDPRRIKELARELGFADEHYFSRFFKKHQGRSPQEYRGDWEKAMGRGAPSPGSGPIPRSIP
ncbi:MAG: helix-turn-helix transcriptional regulator [Spirochaetes bacterium]|nr:helix-turn-helix transcriptional regulator [Spirochaetota bacterium]